MKVLILVTHLLGTGHLSRGLTLARAFAARGHEATVLSGGLPAPQLLRPGDRLRQLPPLRSDGTDFSVLLDETGLTAAPALMEARQSAIAEAIRRIRPDAMITELFPFGRRKLADEFLHAVDTARALPDRPLILCSIRDILDPPSKPARAERAEAIVADLYDGVLVHADPAITPLELSWPVTSVLARKLIYTGFVAPPAPAAHPDAAGAGEIIVSAGGGDVGNHVFASALDAAAHLADRPWRLLVGGRDPTARIARLTAHWPAADHVTLEPARPDFRQMLGHAAASVSMCGYNTALDVLQAGLPAVMIPFDAGKEVEQTIRARALARLPGISVLPASNLNGLALARGLRQVMALPSRTPHALHLDGAARTVSNVEQRVKIRFHDDP